MVITLRGHRLEQMGHGQSVTTSTRRSGKHSSSGRMVERRRSDGLNRREFVRDMMVLRRMRKRQGKRRRIILASRRREIGILHGEGWWTASYG